MLVYILIAKCLLYILIELMEFFLQNLLAAYYRLKMNLSCIFPGSLEGDTNCFYLNVSAIPLDLLRYWCCFELLFLPSKIFQVLLICVIKGA